MGYTHYWTIKRPLTKKVWRAIMSDTRKLLAATVLPLAAEFNTPDEKPIVSAELIRFNGIGAEGHETFMLSRHKVEFEFCKTNQKPYDVIVCAVLIVAAHHAGKAIDVSSDGDAMDWAAALGFARQVLGAELMLPAKVCKREESK